MLEALKKLNESPGINGSLIVASDGLVIATCLDAGMESETAAALTGDIVASAIDMLKCLEGAEMQQMVLTASRGRLVVHAAGGCFLVAVTNQFINLDATHLEIASAARAVSRMASLSS